MTFDIFRKFYRHMRGLNKPANHLTLPISTALKKTFVELEYNAAKSAYTRESKMSYEDYLKKLDSLLFLKHRQDAPKGSEEYGLTDTPYIIHVYPGFPGVPESSDPFTFYSARYYWFYYAAAPLLNSRWNDLALPISFNEVLESVPEEIQEQLLFHLDLFT